MFEVSDVIAAALSRSEFEAGSCPVNQVPPFPLKVLLIHNDPHASAKIGGMLLNKGCQVTLRTTLIEALLLLQSHRFDLLMAGAQEEPCREGTEELRTVRGLYPEMRIVPLTCFSMQEEESFPSGNKCHSEPDHPAGNGEETRGMPEAVEQPPAEYALQHLLMTMSHDLRGSLIALGAGLCLLAAGRFGKIEPSVAKKAAELCGRVKTLTGLAEEFLGKAYVLSEQVEVQSEEADLLDDIIGPVLEEVAPEAGSRDMEIELAREGETGSRLPVQADRVWLKTVIRNLMHNAIKYGDKGSTVRIGVREEGTDYRINVFNSGQPIPDKFRSKLFEKFSRQSRNRSGNGLGLGLYLIRAIVLKHGGSIWYEPQPCGSNFVFTLPRYS